MQLSTYIQSARCRAFTLIETLVASAVLMIGISAASSLSLAMMTQEEINRRTAEAFNLQENAVTLYQLGMDTSEIEALLPTSGTIKSFTFTEGEHDLGSGAGSIDYANITVEFYTTPSTAAFTTGSYIAGESDKVRAVSVRAFRAAP